MDGEYGGIGYLIPGHLWNPSEANTADIAAASEQGIALIYDSYSDDLVSYKADGLNAAIETQTTDVENECDGLYTYDRLIKTDPTRLLLANQKAISGQFTVTTVVPTSQVVPQTWQWTTNTPATNWYATSFNTAGWKTGVAGFGTADPGVTPNTSWTTPGYIYLRRTFNPGTLTARQLSNLSFTVYHDEDVVFYINGVLAGSASGYSSSYVNVPLTAPGLAAIIPNGTNVLAVSCYQSTGGQFIDAGLADEILVANMLNVPNDAVGYWPLDASSGTVAADASGDGDTGTVVNAVWNTYGKINGCLSFNGINSFVQIGNLVSNDFSIAFWIKTTQTAGTGQWYKGTGLVDGYVAANANDFGTALCGRQLAFGVGNPDTTILSTNAINDGTWHYCVATRVKATGALSLYVDGVLQATGSGGTNALNAAGALRLGGLATSGGWFQGSLDEVRLFNRALGNNEVTALFANTSALLAGPTNLVAAAGSGQVALSWNESLFTTNYTVSRATTSGGPYTVIGTTTDTTFTDTNAVNGTTYYYVVAAANVAGPGLNSAEVAAFPFTLAVWYEADTLAGLPSGATVTNWPDSSGNANNAVPASPTQAPVYVSGALNGRPVVRFNATNSTFLAFTRTVQDDFTMLFVFQSTQNNQGTGTAFYQGAGLINGDQPNAQYDFGTQLNADGRVIAGTGNPDVSVESAKGFNNGAPHVVTLERVESTGALTLYVDGTQVASGAGTTISLTAPAQLYLGAVPSGGGFFSGDLAEVLIFDVALTNGSRVAYENALRGKYGLSPATAPGTPAGVGGTAGNREITVTWNPVVGASGYNLWRSGDGSTYQEIASGVNGTSWVDAAAANGRTNYYEVAAVNGIGASTNSAAVAVFLPEPILTGVTAGGGNISLTWPTWASDWTLYYATNLAAPVVWSPATNTVGTNNGQFNATIPANTGMRFFRLGAP